MEGRAVAKSGLHHGGRRLYRKISSSSGQTRGPLSSQFHEKETTEGGRGGDEPVEKGNEKILPFERVSTLREESTEDVVWEEQLRGPAAEREEWKRKGGGWGRLPEGICVNDDEEDGVHGDRMKPLASFDVNRDMPPPQTRKLRIKLSPRDADRPPRMDGAAQKAVRRAQDKENRGLVPLCPGTTQIRGMKRKTVSPTDLKAHGGGKRTRPPFGSGGNATEQLRKGPAESSAPCSAAEFERDNSGRMDMLLMALNAADEKALEAADGNCQRSISASMALAKPTVVQATNGEKILKNAPPTTKVVGETTAHLSLKQDKVDVRKQDDGDSNWSDEDEDEEELKRFLALPCMKPHRIKIGNGPSIPWKERPASTNVDIHTMRVEGEDEDEDDEEFKRFLARPGMRPHRIKIGNGPSIPWKERPVSTNVDINTMRDENEDEDEDEDDEEFKRFLARPGMRPHRIKIGNGPSIPWKERPVGTNVDINTMSDEDDDEDEDEDDEEFMRFLARPGMKPHRIKIGNGPSIPWKDRPRVSDKFQNEQSSGSDGDPDCAEDSSRKYVTGPQSSCKTSQEALDNCKKRPQASKDDEDSDGTEEEVDMAEMAGYQGISFRGQRRKLGLVGDHLDKHAAQPHRFRPPPAKSVDGEKRECKVKNNKVLERGGNPLLDEYAMERHQYQSVAPAGIEEEEKKQQAFEARDPDEAEPSCSDDDVVEYPTRKAHRYRAVRPKDASSKSANLIDGRKENRGGKSSHDGDKNETVVRPQLCKLHPSQVRDQVRTQTRKPEIEAPRHADEQDADKPVTKPLPSNLLPSHATVSLAQDKIEKEKTGCSDEEHCDEPIVMKPHHSKPLPPPQTKVVLSEEQNFKLLRALMEQRGVEPSHAIAIESDLRQQQQQQQQQRKRKMIEHREPPGHDSVVGISQLGEEDRKVEEKYKDRNRERNDFQQSPKHFTGAKYPPGSRQQQSMWRGSSGGARSASDQQPRNYTKKRKSSDHISACCIVPKQVKLATASCLVETGEPSHPSVGSVVVECLPPPTALQKEDNSRAPFCELQNRDVLRSYNSLQLPHPKSAKDVGGVCDTDKENRSWGAGVKVPTCRQIDGGACPIRVITVAGNSNALGSSFSGNSLHPLQTSRVNLGSDSQFVNVTQQQQQQQQQCSIIARTRDDKAEKEIRHEIAGITVQRRSWEALKSAEYFAKRRLGPKPADENSNLSVPSIPARFQEYHVGKGVSNSKPKTNFGTSHFTHGDASTALLGRSVGVNSNNAVLGQKKVTYRRGPYKQGGNKHERLRTKVLNRNLENFAQLQDVKCPDGAIDFSRLHPVQNGAYDFPASGCYNSSQHPLRSYSYSGFPKAPTALKTRQRRGHKKLEKEKLKMLHIKASSNVCKFKPLSEPSGLLSDFNPGIIQRVRNSVQIHAILGTLIRAASCDLPKEPPQDSTCAPPVVTEVAEGELKEKPVDALEPQNKYKDMTKPEAKSVQVQEALHKEESSTQAETSVQIQETLQTREDFMAMGGSIEEEQGPQVQGSDLRKETLSHQGELLLSNAQQSEPPAMPSQFQQVLPENAGLASLKDEDVKADRLHDQSESLLTQGLSIVSGHPEHAEDDSDEQELQSMSGTDSSPTGLAGRWLELLTLDIKGRLSALKRSRRRVQSTLQSGQLNPESASAAINPPSTTRSSIDSIDVPGSQQSVSSDATIAPPKNREDESSSRQVDSWRALFTNMDGVLGTEASKLESWLWQIKQMQAFCPSSIQQPVSAPGDKSDVAASCQGLVTSNLEFGKRQPAERLPLSLEAMEKELWIRRISCFDNLHS